MLTLKIRRFTFNMENKAIHKYGFEDWRTVWAFRLGSAINKMFPAHD